MEVLLVGGPLDGQRVEAAEGATLVTSQKGDSYIRALHGVYVTAEVGTPEGYIEPTGETAAESSVKKAREILSHE